MSKQGYNLADLAMWNLEKLAAMDKQAFEPMLGGQPQQPPQGAPVDPSMAGAAPQGAPMDPMAGGGAPAASLPPPAAAPAAPPAPPAGGDHDAMVNAIRQVMMEMGGGQPQGGKGKGAGGKDVEERLGAIEAALAQVLQALNLASPDQAVADAVSSNAQQGQAGVMSSGSGQADPGVGAMALGPMDPNAGAAMSEMKVPQSVNGIKMGSAPLDSTVKLAAALKKARR